MWKEDKFLRKLASLLTKHCVRDTIEDIHAKYTVSQEEMKNLNTEVRDKIYTLLLSIDNGGFPDVAGSRPPDYWEEPKIDVKMMEGIIYFQKKIGARRG